MTDETIKSAKSEEKTFVARAQEAIESAVETTVEAVKEHPVAAAAIAGGVAAAAAGAAFGVEQAARKRRGRYQGLTTARGAPNRGAPCVPLPPALSCQRHSRALATEDDDSLRHRRRAGPSLPGIGRAAADCPDRLSQGRHDTRSRSASNGSFAYPEIRLRYRGVRDRPTCRSRSFGRLVTPGRIRDQRHQARDLRRLSDRAARPC